MRWQLGFVWCALLLLAVSMAQAAAMTVNLTGPAAASTDTDGSVSFSIATDYNMTSAKVLLYKNGVNTNNYTMTVAATKVTATYAATGLADDVYTFYVTTVNDTDESTAGTSAWRNFTVDRGLTLSAPADDATDEDGTFTFTASKTQAISAATLHLTYPSGATVTRDMTVATNVATYDQSLLPEGLYTWYVTSTPADNRSKASTSSTYGLTVDAAGTPAKALFATKSGGQNSTPEKQGVSGKALLVIGGLLVGVWYFTKKK